MTTLQTINADLEFLLMLEKRLHQAVYLNDPPEKQYPFNVLVDRYTDEKISAAEADRLVEIIDKSDYAFYPIMTVSLCAVGFQITEPDTCTPLLTFNDGQLPREYDFKRLSEYFMRPGNVERSRKLGVDIENDCNEYSKPFVMPCHPLESYDPDRILRGINIPEHSGLLMALYLGRDETC
jgi:hypothetical protein